MEVSFEEQRPGMGHPGPNPRLQPMPGQHQQPNLPGLPPMVSAPMLPGLSTVFYSRRYTSEIVFICALTLQPCGIVSTLLYFFPGMLPMMPMPGMPMPPQMLLPGMPPMGLPPGQPNMPPMMPPGMPPVPRGVPPPGMLPMGVLPPNVSRIPTPGQPGLSLVTSQVIIKVVVVREFRCTI